MARSGLCTGSRCFQAELECKGGAAEEAEEAEAEEEEEVEGERWV